MSVTSLLNNETESKKPGRENRVPLLREDTTMKLPPMLNATSYVSKASEPSLMKTNSIVTLPNFATVSPAFTDRSRETLSQLTLNTLKPPGAKGQPRATAWSATNTPPTRPTPSQDFILKEYCSAIIQSQQTRESRKHQASTLPADHATKKAPARDATTHQRGCPGCGRYMTFKKCSEHRRTPYCMDERDFKVFYALVILRYDLSHCPGVLQSFDKAYSSQTKYSDLIEQNILRHIPIKEWADQVAMLRWIGMAPRLPKLSLKLDRFYDIEPYHDAIYYRAPGIRISNPVTLSSHRGNWSDDTVEDPDMNYDPKRKRSTDAQHLPRKRRRTGDHAGEGPVS